MIEQMRRIDIAYRGVLGLGQAELASNALWIEAPPSSELYRLTHRFSLRCAISATSFGKSTPSRPMNKNPFERGTVIGTNRELPAGADSFDAR